MSRELNIIAFSKQRKNHPDSLILILGLEVNSLCCIFKILNSYLGALTILVGESNNHFELNGGVFVGQGTTYDKSFLLPFGNIGYRYQKPEGGFIFKAKLGVLGLGFGLGYAFKSSS